MSIQVSFSSSSKQNHPKRKNGGTSPKPDQILLSRIIRIIFAFSCISFLTCVYWYSGYLDHPDRKYKAAYSSDTNDRIIELGPVITQKENEVYRLTLRVDLRKNSSMVARIDVLDMNKEHVMGFEEQEFWYETGKDRYGSWSERSGSSFQETFVISTPGTYYLAVQIDNVANNDEVAKHLKNAEISLSMIRGSTIPHFIYAQILIFCAIFLQLYKWLYSANNEITRIFVSAFVTLMIYFITNIWFIMFCMVLVIGISILRRAWWVLTFFGTRRIRR